MDNVKDVMSKFKTNLDNIIVDYKKNISDIDKLLSDDKLKKDKEEFESKVDSYSKLFEIIDEEKFNGLIEDVDVFEEAIDKCKLSKDEISLILNIAIKCNLEFLDSSGMVVDDVDDDINNMKEQNNKIQDQISDLSNLLGDE